MNFSGAQFLAAVIPLTLGMLALAMVLAFVRVARGPSLPDRVIALDLTAMVVVGSIAVLQIQSREPLLLDTAIVLAMIAFLSTVAFARYLERGGRK